MVQQEVDLAELYEARELNDELLWIDTEALRAPAFTC